MSQLPLGLVLRERSTFDSFYAAGNEPIVAFLRAFAQGRGEVAWLAGPARSGKTHLANACCLSARHLGRGSAYLPLDQLAPLGPAVLEGWEQHALVCLDGLQHVVGDSAWEQALFALFNGTRDQGGQVLSVAPGGPRSYPFALPDLQSRLGWGGVFELRGLSDPDRIEALRLRARGRGLELPEETGRYLLQRLPRDMGSLFAFLDTLDQASLAAQRKLTIPFAREVLERHEDQGG